MNSTEIKYVIDNRFKIVDEIDKIAENLPQETAERLQENLEKLNVEEIYNIINSANPNIGLTLSSLKLILFLDLPDSKDQLFSNDEYINILKNIVDIYGERLSEIISIHDSSFNMDFLDSLLSYDDPKYSDVYKSVLIKKLLIMPFKDVAEFLKKVNTSIVSEELVMNYLANYNKTLYGSDTREFLNNLPSSILQDGVIAKTIIGKKNSMVDGDEVMLDYIPSSAYDAEFVKEILDKSDFNFRVFDHIPNEFKTTDVWEKACDANIYYLRKLSNSNTDLNISQEEYISWFENLIIRKITENPEDALAIFNVLTTDKKTVSICQTVADHLSLDKHSHRYEDLLKSIPESSRTQLLYETLVAKSPLVLIDIPLQSFMPNISQEEYDKWFENLILQSIARVQDIDDIQYLTNYIPRKKINERIWNELLDKCETENIDRKSVSLTNVDFENITPQMVERAMKEIELAELFHVPCVDKNLDDLNDIQKEKYERWQASLTEEQKQAYRDWYEQIWIKYVNDDKGYGAIYQYVPKEAITTAMNKACLDGAAIYAIQKIPLPETPEQVYEYQQLLIYALSKVPASYIDIVDIFENIPKEFISEEVVRQAVVVSIQYLKYADPTAENFKELVDRAFKNKLASMGRTELTDQEYELMQKFAVNNSDLFDTLKLEMLDPVIVNAIGESSLEKITRYGDVQGFILKISTNESALKTFGFALENLKMDNIFIEPLIEKLSESISSRMNKVYNNGGFSDETAFLDIVSQRIDRKDIPFTDYEKAIISYLTLNPKESRKINSYDDILTFVERINNELEQIINDENSTLLEVKNAYLERIVGLDYDAVLKLVTMYGNDPEQLLQNYKDVSHDSFKELSEIEALEIIIKLKSLIETQDINAIRSEFQKSISQEGKEDSYLRYQKSTLLETTLRRAYGRDMVETLSNTDESFQMKEFEFEGEKYFVKKVDGNFNRMVSLLGAYRQSTATEGDMYDRWNTNQMAGNHALCYSLINQSNPGTAMIDGKKGIVISINGFSPESISAAAPYDLCSIGRLNTIITMRQQRFYSARNMPNQTRCKYSEYDIEIQDVMSGGEQYKKIQPASIICFEEVDEDSIRAAIELGKKMGHPVPIELIDRRELAKNEMMQIMAAFNKFTTSENIDPSLVSEIITRFNNVRNAHRSSNLSDELLGETYQKENVDAPFNSVHLNEILIECLANVEMRIRNGQVQEGLKALESIKAAIASERRKPVLLSTMNDKQLWTGIDMEIDYTLDEIQRTYGQQIVEPLKEIKTVTALSQMQGQDLSSVTFDATYGKMKNKPEQLTVDQIIQLVDMSKVERDIEEIHAEGYYQGNKNYDEEHIARVIMYSDAISKMDGYDDQTRKLLTEVAKYYSCGRQLDTAEQHGQYSAKLAGKALTEKYSSEELGIIQATIELANFRSSSRTLAEIEEDRKVKLTELCSKYGISEQAEVVSKMAGCICDSVILDQTRFVDKAKPGTFMLGGAPLSNDIPTNVDINELQSDSAKKMVEFSYLIQEKLAEQELEKYSSIVKIYFDDKEMMEKFFTVIYGNYNAVHTKDESITQSPIVRLEYLKTKYPELANIDLDEIQKQRQSGEDIKSLEILRLEELKKDLMKTLSEAEEIIQPNVNLDEESRVGMRI